MAELAALFSQFLCNTFSFGQLSAALSPASPDQYTLPSQLTLPAQQTLLFQPQQNSTSSIHPAVPALANSASPVGLAANSDMSSSLTDPAPANSICSLSPLPNSMQPSNSCFSAFPAATADTLRWVHRLCCNILQGVWLFVCRITCIDHNNTIHDFECICVQFCMIVHRYAMKL